MKRVISVYIMFWVLVLLVLEIYIPTRATLRLNIVAVTMPAVFFSLIYSIYLSRIKKNTHAHRKIQVVLFFVLLVSVLFPEFDDTALDSMDAIIESSSYNYTYIRTLLYIHLFFAITSSLSWFVIMIRCVSIKPLSFQWKAHSIWFGWFAMITMLGALITGDWFYLVGFVL